MSTGYGTGARIAAASSSLVLLAASAPPLAASPAAMPGPASASPSDLAIDPPAGPALIWGDVASVGVTCLVHTARGIDSGALHDRLCAAVRTHAARNAPVPVVAAALGGEALAAGRVTLLVQATVAAVRGADVVALTIRPFRNAADAGQLFGAAPRVVAADDPAALDKAVAALLAETLPWQADAVARRSPLRP
ncbi:hypothetical protein ASE95_16715 [Sphingomonas sp. Leaf231]|uniref:hypothetical protein n=1 Tax=Sphingomonas sp. Leaf231 TaxID=1736301 RepID=UPI0006F460F0|nr:hypothetical protein [Sphingomonas sp. Leaf231]KQN89816.1 hypothetical protein ASE95_16715 [Sphingomonas sp. Leaf231]